MRKNLLQPLILTLFLALVGCGQGNQFGQMRDPGPWRDWDKPTEPKDVEAYNFAHAIELPESVPKPVPFQFCKSEIFGFCLKRATPEEYFDHLCKTEAGEYIFKTVENVEGIYQMRPRKRATEALLQDRYAMEDPWGAESGEASGAEDIDVADFFVQPFFGEYSFLEQPKNSPTKYVQYYRNAALDNPAKYSRGYNTNIGSQWITVPYMVDQRELDDLKSQYGFTWRGIRRPNDREFGIAGGEVVVMDLQTHKVLGINRGFVKTGHVRNNQTGIYWQIAQPCGQQHVMNHEFVKKVLKPVVDINKPFMPKN